MPRTKPTSRLLFYKRIPQRHQARLSARRNVPILSGLLFVAGLASSLVTGTLPARGACGPSATPTYRDITAIRYARTGCVQKCPIYQVLVTGLGACYYIGEAYVHMQGTYEAKCAPGVLDRAIGVLKNQDFFGLNHEPSVVTGVPHYV